MHRIHRTTGLTQAMRMKTLHPARCESVRIRVPPGMTSLRSRILPYFNVRTSFQTIA
jgi:hypothetical protein